MLKLALVIQFLALCVLAIVAEDAVARDSGQWTGNSPDVRMWFRSLMQPDNPLVSCCGEADGFPIDHWTVNSDGDFDVLLVDGRQFKTVPKAKMQWKYGNPTGRDILFVGSGGTIYCLVLGTGI